MRNILIVGMVLVFLAGCATVKNEPTHVVYGKVLSVQPHSVVEQQPNLTGAVVGGVAGGVVGHQFGKGSGKTAMTVLGAVAGATVGSQVGKMETVKQVSDLVVQMPDGRTFNITTPDVGFQPGQEVKIVQQGHNATIEAIKN
jgi:outer membrane lipoprotein SlyB